METYWLYNQIHGMGCTTGFGWVTIYEYVDTVGWVVKGAPIYSDQDRNSLGCALSFSGNGNELAIGAFAHDLGAYPNHAQGKSRSILLEWYSMGIKRTSIVRATSSRTLWNCTTIK